MRCDPSSLPTTLPPPRGAVQSPRDGVVPVRTRPGKGGTGRSAIPLALVLLLSACARGGPAAPPPALGFVDRLPGSGVAFVNHTGDPDSKPWVVQAKGAGVVALDYDGDGDLDLFFVDGNRFELDAAGVVVTRTADPAAGSRLYRNDGGWHFTDVTKASGLGKPAFSITATVGDYDNDGDPDLYLCNWGENLLFRNNGDGTFTDVTEEAGVAGPPDAYSTCAAFFDADGDGRLDLYVANYCDLEAAMRERKGDPPGQLIDGLWRYAGPRFFRATPDLFFRNSGGGKFLDDSSGALRDQVPSYGFQPVPFDADNDGDLDLYVANDCTPNFLWLNDGAGTFTEVGRKVGVSLSDTGGCQAGMGTSVGDFDRDGWMDIIVTNFSADWTTIYRNRSGDGHLFFTDSTHQIGLGIATFNYVSWGVAFRDFDLDGVLDIFVANGGVYPTGAPDRIFEHATYEEPLCLFLGTGPPDYRFRDVSQSAGPALTKRHVARGCSFADIDDDGDEDVVISCLNTAPVLLENRLPKKGHWIRIRPVGRESNRDAIGARIEVVAGGVRQIADHTLAGSFGGSADPRVLFGLGAATRVDVVRIRWPSGRKQEFRDLAVDRTWRIVEGRDLER